MRLSFLTLIPIFLGTFALASTPTTPQSRDLTADFPLEGRADSVDFIATLSKAKGNKGNKCKNNPLRDPHDHCECKPGLIDLMGSCCCGDTENTLLTLQGCGGEGGCDRPVCKCNAKNAEYDLDKLKCVCKSGYHAKYKPDGELKCKPGVTPSAKPKHTRRELAEAIHERRHEPVEVASRSLEEIMSCSATEKACQRGLAYVCTDVMNNLASCGGCPGEAEDCASIPGVDQVRCERGQCVIDTCQRGYTHRTYDVPANSTTRTSFCKPPKSGGSWFVKQGAFGSL